MADWTGMRHWGGGEVLGKGSCPSATLSATNPTWTEVKMHPSLRGERPRTYVTVLWMHCVTQSHRIKFSTSRSIAIHRLCSLFPIVTAYMNVFPADRQNIPCRGPMPFEFIQPAAMVANNNRMRDAGGKSRACSFAFCCRKGVGCYVAHSGNFSTNVSKQLATPIIKHCIFWWMDTNRLPKQALKCKPNGRRNIGRLRKRWRDQLHLEDQGTG